MAEKRSSKLLMLCAPLKLAVEMQFIICSGGDAHLPTIHLNVLGCALASGVLL